MRKAFVSLVGALAALAANFYFRLDLLSYAFAILALVLGVVIWAVGRFRRRDYGADALAVAVIGTVQLLAFPMRSEIEQWQAERWRPSSPWSSTVDSALAVRPAPDVPGSYDFIICFEKCSASSMAQSWVKQQIILLPVSSVESAFPEKLTSPNGCIRDVQRKGSAWNSAGYVRPIYWIQSRYGAVTWRELEQRGGEWVYETTSEMVPTPTEVAITNRGFVGATDGMYVAGQRIQSGAAVECV